MDHVYSYVFLASCFIIFGLIGQWLAIRKNRNPAFWFLMGVSFGIFAIFALVLLGKQKMRPSLSDPSLLDGSLGDRLDSLSLSFIENLHWYYLGEENKQVGPVAISEFKKAILQGEIDTSTYVWREDFEEWKKLEECLEDESLAEVKTSLS